MDIDDIVSPSDKELVHLIYNLIDDIAKVRAIFADRNSDNLNVSLSFAIVLLVIERFTGLEVNAHELMDFLASVNDREISDGDED